MNKNLKQMEMNKRLNRIYSAVGELYEWDVEKAQEVTVSHDGDAVGETVSFAGGLSRETIENRAQSAIANVANLKDHLLKWAKTNGKNKKNIEDAIQNSFELKVVLDLADYEKHGPKRVGDNGYSKCAPKILSFHKSLRVGFPKELEPHVAISGDVVDKDGKNLGDFNIFLSAALEVWERVSEEIGVRFE